MNHKSMYKAGIVCCSNGLSAGDEMQLWQLKEVLENMGIQTVFNDYLFAVDGVRSATAKERADALMECYCNSTIDIIFDISGGDIANEILPYLDYRKIATARNHAGEPKQFWGYSDLTVILNAVYARAGNAGVLYQVRHLTESCNREKLTDFADAVFYGSGAGKEEPVKGRNSLFDFDYSFLQGKELTGTVVGGNIRCLLKLAGTSYFPDLTDKVLFLEARSGLRPQMITYLAHLKQLDAFEKVRGILLGTFTQLEKEEGMVSKTVRKDNIRYEKTGSIGELVKEFARNDVPIVKTFELGHGKNARALRIGGQINLKKF